MLPDLFKRLKPLYGSVIDALWIEYQTADVLRRREIEELLVLVAVRRLGTRLGEERIVLDPPPRTLIGTGEYTIGDVLYPGIIPFPARVRRNELLRHLFLLGPTGTGKSTFILHLVEQLLRDDVPCWLFDFKRNYRCLLGAPYAKTLVVLSVGRSTAPLHVNALRAPPGVLTSEWIEALADVMSTAYLLMQGARNVLKDALARVVAEWHEEATLLHAYRAVRAELGATRVGSRRYGWLESAARTLAELTSGTFGITLNNDRAPPFAALLNCSVVFEAQSLGDDQKRFFCLYALQYILMLRKNASVQREELRHVLVFDESHHVFPKDPPGQLGVPSRLAREIREYGEAIIAATQQSDVSNSLIANSGFKIILRCDFPQDVEFASKLLQVEQRWISKLPMGQAIVRFPVRYFPAFLLAFPEHQRKNTMVNDETVATRYHETSRPDTTTPQQDLSDKEETLLRDIATHAISGITQRYQRLAWNPKTGHAIVKRLLARRLVRFEDVTTPKARIRILTLTTDGRLHLKEQGIPPPPQTRGGVTHEYWRHIIKQRLLKKGYRVEEEYTVGEGQAVDLYATKCSKQVFIEIETGKSDLLANIKKCSGLPGRVVFFFTDPALSERQTDWPPQIQRLTPHELEHADPF